MDAFGLIHSLKGLCSTSSRKLLKCAPDSSTIKKNRMDVLDGFIGRWMGE